MHVKLQPKMTINVNKIRCIVNIVSLNGNWKYVNTKVKRIEFYAKENVLELIL